ncbi:hypothetical protein BBJ28_00020201 [Nothophytophthora sp. Chile5]|nr:hypothetical protein BBJ28_00020201 [Nothophytophthora sp. Chile5]
MDDQVDQRLKNNPKVRVQGDQYAYQIPEGMPIEDLIDCYVGVENDLKDLTRTGEVICLKNAEKGAEVYYSRAMSFLVDLSGVATVEAGTYLAHTSQDISSEIRRGDAFRIGDNWFRVSAAVKVLIATILIIRTFMFKFDKDHLPLDVPFPDAKKRNVASNDRWDVLPKRGPKFPMVKHDTLRAWPSDRAEFERKLVQAGLTTQAKVDANRRQLKRRMKEDKKKNRPRKQRDIKISNQHLIGTKLGEILAKGSQEQFTLGAVKFEKN